MTTQISDEEFTAQHPEYAGLDSNIRAQIRQNAQLTADLEAERATRTSLERRAAFAEAGLADVPHRELFEKSYEGEMTAEAIRAEAEKYGLTGTQTPPPPPVEDRSGLDALRRVAAASNGAPAGAPMLLEDAMDRARSPQELDAIIANAPPEAGIALPRSVRGSRLI